ncbi:MAG: DNA repair protein RadC [Gemmatimonadetes bacterium]|nr:DNA repair protein RadC [Gemmatimonadota bacterium]MBT8405734.1 DNA repair protein RadC [Gemmatimonadota bacterium]NNF38668.1 DNA repair protein RadC [Gemmatimonadota bacterium]NNK61567.1 DNA repair protein RadC [Gemmatimonadota bacterium]
MSTSSLHPDRPRERLHRLGPRALAERELLALLLGAGRPGHSALAVADDLLALGPLGVRSLARMPPGRLSVVQGVGRARAARLSAGFEIGRRTAAASGAEARRIRGPSDVYDSLGPNLRDLDQEEFHAVLLNAQHRVLREVLVTRGILDASLVHPREVFRPAVAEGAAAVILVHNHPSGDPTPSAQDRAVTRQMVSAGRTLGIPVLDHVIVGDGRWAALSDEGAL